MTTLVMGRHALKKAPLRPELRGFIVVVTFVDISIDDEVIAQPQR